MFNVIYGFVSFVLKGEGSGGGSSSKTWSRARNAWFYGGAFR